MSHMGVVRIFCTIFISHPPADSVTRLSLDQAVHSPLFSRIFIRFLKARIESRENWTPAQKERLDWVGGGDRDSSCSLRSQTPASTAACFALTIISLASSFACVNRETFNSLFQDKAVKLKITLIVINRPRNPKKNKKAHTWCKVGLSQYSVVFSRLRI